MSGVVTIFGTSRCQPSDPLYPLAEELGRRLAQCGWTICNGGYGGTMEAAARGARDAGGETIGVICRALGRGPANRFIGRTIETGTLLERLERLIGLGDAYVVLPGGTGTLLELSAVWEMTNKGLIAARPIVAWREPWEAIAVRLRAVQADDVSLSFVSDVSQAIAHLEEGRVVRDPGRRGAAPAG